MADISTMTVKGTLYNIKDGTARTEIENLKSIGRFLSIWDCTTGLPNTNPTTLPYTYKTGDYYRVGTVATGSYTHSISIVGNTTSLGTYTGTYTLSLNLSNQSGTQILTIPSLVSSLEDYTLYDATGTIVADGTTYAVAKVLKWNQDDVDYLALCDSDNSKLALVLESTSQTDTVSGSGVNYKPNGSSYTGTASTTVETESVKVGWVYYYDGTTWMAQSAGGAVWGSITGTLSSQTDLQTALNAKESSSNKVTSISSSSTDVEYPSAKLLYDQLEIKAGCKEITVTLSQIISQSPLTFQFTSEQQSILEDTSVQILKLTGSAQILGYAEYMYFQRTMGTTDSNPYIYFVRASHTFDSNEELSDFGFYAFEYNSSNGQGILSQKSVSTLISGKEDTSNKVTSISSSSTDTQYPSAKCVYEAIESSGGEAFTAAEVDTIFDGVA